MSGTCPDLATKSEVAALKAQVDQKLTQKLGVTDEPVIIEQAIAGSSNLLSLALLPLQAGLINNQAKTKIAINNLGKVTQGISQVSAKVNVNTNKLINNNAAILSNSIATKKANYQALYAASQASAAKNVGFSAVKTATKAFSAVASITSLLGTFATMAMMAAMQQQIINLKNQLVFNRQITEQNKLKVNQSLLNDSVNKRKIDEINTKMLIYDKQIKTQNAQIVANNKAIQINQQRLTISEARIEQWSKTIDKRIETVTQEIQQIENKVQSQIDAVSKKIETVNNTAQQLESKVNQANMRMSAITLEQKDLSNSLQETKLSDVVKVVEKVVDKKIETNTRIRKLGDKVTKYDLANKSLKGSQINLRSSLDGISREFKSGLEKSYRLGDDNIRELKSYQDSLKNEQIFFKQEITKLKRQNLNEVNNQQVAEINNKLDKIDSNILRLPNLSTIALAVGGLDIFRQILNKKNPLPSCQAPALVPPVAAQARANGIATAGLQAVTVAQNTAIQKTVNFTKNIVSHPTFGLETVQKYASTAWQATHADKVLNVISTTMAIHNGMMLSNNLLSTIEEALNMTLQATGIRDEKDKPIDLDGIVKSKIRAILSKLIGGENYTALTTRIAKTNRIYQTGINVLDATTSLVDSLNSTVEIGIEHTGKIGNSLRDSKVVAEDAYGEMIERLNPQNKALRKIQSFRNKVNIVDDGVSTVSQISGGVVEIQDNFDQLEAEKETFLTEINLDKDQKTVETEEIKVNSTVNTDITDEDFTRVETS